MLHITDIIVVEEEEIERNVEVSDENELLTQPLAKQPDQERPQEKGLSLKLANLEEQQKKALLL